MFWFFLSWSTLRYYLHLAPTPHRPLTAKWFLWMSLTSHIATTVQSTSVELRFISLFVELISCLLEAECSYFSVVKTFNGPCTCMYLSLSLKRAWNEILCDVLCCVVYPWSPILWLLWRALVALQCLFICCCCCRFNTLTCRIVFLVTCLFSVFSWSWSPSCIPSSNLPGC